MTLRVTDPGRVPVSKYRAILPYLAACIALLVIGLLATAYVMSDT
jgi:hypothetical protein